MSSYIKEVENYFGYGENATEVVYPDETLPPGQCTTQLDKDVKIFWDITYSMAGVAMLTILMPYVFFCCKNRPRIIAKIFGLSGTVHVIIGLLLSTVLMPQCPLECGKIICAIHKYSPGPIYGCIVMFVGILWWCKACALRRRAKREEIEAEAQRAEGAAGSKPAGSDIV